MSGITGRLSGKSGHCVRVDMGVCGHNKGTKKRKRWPARHAKGGEKGSEMDPDAGNEEPKN